MAKQKSRATNGEKGLIPSAYAKQIQKAAAVDAAIIASNAMGATSAAKKSSEAVEKAAAAASTLYEAARKNQSRGHVAGKDLGGQLIGVLSYEGLNYVMRRIADWSPKFAENIDIYQSLPHLCIGIIAYWWELLTRKPDATGKNIFPGLKREVASEWAKAFSLLGANNLWRAMRVRRGDTTKTLADLKAAQLELEALKAELQAAKKA